MAAGDITTSESGVPLIETEECIKVSMYTCLLCGAKNQYKWPRVCCDGVDRSSMTFREIQKAALPGAVYDTALPQSWYDEVLQRTGVNPSGHFVWLYDDAIRGIHSGFGEPVALSNVAQWLVNSGQVKARIILPIRIHQ